MLKTKQNYKPRILLLTFYYPPDLSAGSFRMQALVKTLKQLVPKSEVSFDIYTTMPNRYFEFKCAVPEIEQDENISIYRYQLPKHKNGFIDQAKAYQHFYKWAKRKAKKSKYDLVFATSGRLFTAFLGAQISKSQKCPLYLDIRDIFVDTMSSILSKKLKIFLLPIFKIIERKTKYISSRIH